MNKAIYFLLSVLLTLSFLPAIAQDEERKFKLGAKLGINLHNISDDPGLMDSDTGLSSEFGIFGRIGERVYLQTGLDFVNYKMHAIRTVQPRPGERDVIVGRYLRVPVQVGMRTTYDGSVVSHLRFYGGPASLFNVGVKDNNLALRRRDVRNAQFALTGGVGLDIRFASLDITYLHGLSTVLNDDNSEGKARAFGLTIGFAL
jgi:hypothetical protein